jgi:hypothetical protein
MRIATSKEAFNRKISLLTSKLNVEFRKKLVMCYVRSIAFYGSETWVRKGSEHIWGTLKYSAGGEWSEKVTNEQVLECIGE